MIERAQAMLGYVRSPLCCFHASRAFAPDSHAVPSEPVCFPDLATDGKPANGCQTFVDDYLLSAKRGQTNVVDNGTALVGHYQQCIHFLF